MEVLSVEEDKKSGLITVSVSWKEPEIVAEWANELVRQLNVQLRKKAIEDSNKRVGYLEKELGKVTIRDMRSVLYNLLEFEKKKAMLANVNEDFALKVIDPAVVPESRESPKKEVDCFVWRCSWSFFGRFNRVSQAISYENKTIETN